MESFKSNPMLPPVKDYGDRIPDFSSICIFLVSGKTFTFRNIDTLITNESMITFNYKAMSDKMYKTAYFSRQNVAGYSLT